MQAVMETLFDTVYLISVITIGIIILRAAVLCVAAALSGAGTERPYGSAKEQKDRAFRWMWLTIVLSFGFYIPVVLWADAVPMIGMLMIPKTCAYVWTVLIGYSAMKRECGQEK